MWRVEVGDCRRVMADMPDGSVDSVVCDPPYELGFMGKSWDASGVAYDVSLWAEVLRLLKPGGHLLAFGGSRTYHRLACAVEDAGFEIRDQIMWVYGSGFPKSHNIAIGIDKQAGVMGHRGKAHYAYAHGTDFQGRNMEAPKAMPPHEGITDEAKRWEGWGTALKPAHEPIVVARKPLVGTVAANVLEYGTGGLNIDGCRVAFESDADRRETTTKNAHADFGTAPGGNTVYGDFTMVERTNYDPPGRWPANLIHDGSDEVLGLFPDTGKSTGGRIGKKSMGNVTNVPAGRFEAGDPGYGDSGSAARFFYCAKANKKERNEGLDGFVPKRDSDRLRDDGIGGDNPRNRSNAAKLNHHPTVKPTELMRYLCRLVTPPNGTVLDPFCGSGSTGKAAVLEGFSFVGIEQDAEYADIAKARIRHADERR